jgi:hypothetical protein
MERDLRNANFMIVGSKKLPVKQNFSIYLNLLKEKRAYVIAANNIKCTEKT